MTKKANRETVSYSVVGIPIEIWDAAKATAAQYSPPLSMRWVMIELLRKFGEHQRKTPLKPEIPEAIPEPAPPRPKYQKRPKPRPDPGTTVMAAPDLGTSF